LNRDLFCFWKCARENLKEMVEKIRKIKRVNRDGERLFNSFKEDECNNDLERAIRFFILNRITFSGLVDVGGYSEQAFKTRFTDTSIDRLMQIGPLLRDVEITNLDYEEVIFESGKEVFIFLDPPYFSARKSKLYGKEGQLHLDFDHEAFAESMSKCKHKWLITYDNSKKIRDLFSFANIEEWELQYGMNNFGQERIGKGQELFISNYNLEEVKVKNRAFMSAKSRSLLDFV